jgi:hypothetical protein
MVDLQRRFFTFGAVATLIVPSPKSFFILKPAALVVVPCPPTSDALQQMIKALEMFDAMVDEMTGIPRWAVISEAAYNQLTGDGKT